jgi:NADH dehydrogenase
MVTEIDENGVTFKKDDESSKIETKTVIWSAGVKPSPLGKMIADGNENILDKTGRVKVKPDLSVPGYDNVFVIGDLAYFAHQTGEPLPGDAPVAMSEGRYVAKAIKAEVRGKKYKPFRFFNKGKLAVIGRHSAVADFGKLKVSGYLAWLIWLFVHLMYIVEYENRLIVFMQWAWNYFTRDVSARLITHDLDKNT